MPEYDLALISQPQSFVAFGSAAESAATQLASVREEFDAAVKRAGAAWHGDASEAHSRAAQQRGDAVTKVARAIGRAGQAASTGGEQMQAMVMALREFVQTLFETGFIVLPGGIVQPGPEQIAEAASAGPGAPAVLAGFEEAAAALTIEIESQVVELTAIDGETAAQIEAVLAELAEVAGVAPVGMNPSLAGFSSDLQPGDVRYGDLKSFTDPDETRGTSMEAYLTPSMFPDPGTRAGRPIPASLRPAGYQGVSGPHAKGHLLADTLGGSNDDPRNFVTLYHRFKKGDNHINDTPMREMEMRMRRVVEGKQDGVPAQNVRYKVEALGDDRLPHSIRITAIGDRGYREVATIPNQ